MAKINMRLGSLGNRSLGTWILCYPRLEEVISTTILFNGRKKYNFPVLVDDAHEIGCMGKTEFPLSFVNSTMIYLK